ncbi:hypothetical protein ATANTOWER_013437 [Ataeniobius toweri]|uniref:Uncharacterized protein n=1 Tax=Ataeniobius toweri TaxID=208326 RepID=A0ABU7AFD9_9TELE|nr:hypothetical protein [Ataeniobius toweri]
MEGLQARSFCSQKQGQVCSINFFRNLSYCGSSAVRLDYISQASMSLLPVHQRSFLEPVLTVNTLRSTNRILVFFHGWSRCCRINCRPKYSIIWQPFRQVRKMQCVQQGSCDVFQMLQHQSLKEIHDHKCQDDRPLVI